MKDQGCWTWGVISLILCGCLYGQALQLAKLNEELSSVKAERTLVLSERDALRLRIKKLEEPSSVKLRVTAYCAEKRQTDADPKVMATMNVLGKPKPGRVAAVSQDRLHWLGKWVYAKGWGVRRVEDLMAPGKKDSLDLLMDCRSASTFTPEEVQVVVFD